MKITQPSQSGYAKLQYRFAVTSGSSSIVFFVCTGSGSGSGERTRRNQIPVGVEKIVSGWSHEYSITLVLVLDGSPEHEAHA